MKVPEPRKLKSGSWFIQMRLNGVSVPVTASTEKECRTQAQLIKAEYRAGKRIKQSEPTLTKAIDNYIDKRKNTLSPSTIVGYRRIQKARFKSYMGKKLSDIDLQTMCDEEAKLCGPRTLKNSFRLIQSVMKENGITYRPVTLPVMQPKTRPFLDPDQVKILVASAKNSPDALPVLLGLHSLRRSEMLALEWGNVDLENKRITVSGAVVKDESGKYVKKAANKNTASTRTIPIMIPELEELLKAVPEDKRKGRLLPCCGDTVAKMVNRACKAAGVPPVGTHGLRHAFASTSYSVGLTELETMELGGWSDAQTMRRIYTHLASNDRLKAENKLAAFFKNANENANEDQQAQ